MTVMLGEIPSEWNRVRVKDVLDFRYGKALQKPKRRPGSVAVFSSAGHIDQHDEALTEGPAIVIARKGVGVGDAFLAPGPCWVIDTALYADVPPGTNARFLTYQLQALELSALDRSSAIPGLNRTDLGRVMLALPPLDVQNAIVAKLDAQLADIRRGVQEIDEGESQINVLAGAVLDRAVALASDGQPVPLRDAIDVMTSGSRDWKPYYNQGSAVFVLAQNVRPRRLDFTEVQHVNPPENDPSTRRSAVRKDDVLVTIVGAGTGTVARVTEDLQRHYVCQSVALIRPTVGVLSGRFLEIFLSAPSWGRRALDDLMYGQGRPHLGFADMKAIEIPLPTVAEQLALADEVDAALEELDRLRRELALVRGFGWELQRAVVRAAVTGGTRSAMSVP